MLRNERFDRDDERGERTFHVGRAATVEMTVAQCRLEWVAAPRIERSRRHDVGVTGEADERAPCRPPRPEVGDAVGLQRLAAESERCKSRASSVWQPASSGVSDRRAISSRASARTGVAALSIRSW